MSIQHQWLHHNWLNASNLWASSFYENHTPIYQHNFADSDVTTSISDREYASIGVGLTFSGLAIAANIIVLKILRSKGNKRTVFDLTIASLACTDLLASISFFITLPFPAVCKLIRESVTLLPSTKFIDIYNFVSVIFVFCFILLSIFHVLLISFQRFFAFFFPFRCRQYFTKSLAKILIALIWTISLAAGPFLMTKESTFSALAIVIFAVGGLLLCMYFMLAFKMCQMLKTNRYELRREHRALLNALGVTVSFFACLSPAGYARITSSLHQSFFFSFASINFLLDPLLYFYMSFWLKRRDDRRAANAVHSANTTQSTDTRF